MGRNTAIEWCDATFNPWIGCTKVSAGCQHCYAEELMSKRFGEVQWGPAGTRKRTSPANWRKPLQSSQMDEELHRRWDYYHGTEHAYGPNAPVWKVGKKAAGRLLDGREWNEYPEVAKQ